MLVIMLIASILIAGLAVAFKIGIRATEEQSISLPTVSCPAYTDREIHTPDGAVICISGASVLIYDPHTGQWNLDQ